MSYKIHGETERMAGEFGYNYTRDHPNRWKVVILSVKKHLGLPGIYYSELRRASHVRVVINANFVNSSIVSENTGESVHKAT